MKRKSPEEQIAFVLKQAEHGTPELEAIRKMGITEQTFYQWKKKYGGLETNEPWQLKQLEEENHKLKRMLADLNIVKYRLQEVLSKKL